MRHTKRYVYLQHSGEPYNWEAASLILGYPHAYSDLGVILQANPSLRESAAEFLTLTKAASVWDRVMFRYDPIFGRDNAISPSIE